MKSLPAINADWTLFLDRDGVINEEKENDYVYNYSEFRFLPGVLEAMQLLSGIFTRIILVTNQRGVGRGLMTEATLREIHKQMLEELKEHGGRIDSIYYCTVNDNTNPNRKPNPGMAFQAREDFPEIKFEQSFMVGNNLSDMAFGKNAGMKTVHVFTTLPEFTSPHPLIDYAYPDLLHFARAVAAQRSITP